MPSGGVVLAGGSQRRVGRVRTLDVTARASAAVQVAAEVHRKTKSALLLATGGLAFPGE